jgi:hypothetical protein
MKRFCRRSNGTRRPVDCPAVRAAGQRTIPPRRRENFCRWSPSPWHAPRSGSLWPPFPRRKSFCSRETLLQLRIGAKVGAQREKIYRNRETKRQVLRVSPRTGSVSDGACFAPAGHVGGDVSPSGLRWCGIRLGLFGAQSLEGTVLALNHLSRHGLSGEGFSWCARIGPCSRSINVCL